MASSFNPGRVAVGAVFQGSGAPSTALAFHRLGQYCVCGTADGTLRLIDAVAGTAKKVVHDRKRGVGAACFSHHAQSVLVAGGAAADGFPADAAKTVRYWSLYDNRYLRAFAGHDAPVTAVAPSPASDAFFTAGADGRVVLWDLAAPRAAVAALSTADAAWDRHRRTAGSAVAAFSADAVVFAVGAARADGSGGAVKVYDVRNYGGGPFATFAVDRDAAAAAGGTPEGAWTGLEFSPDGESLLVSAPGAHVVLCAFEGHVKAALPCAGPGTACFTPDGNHVVGGGDDGALRVWRVDAPKRRASQIAGHAGPVGKVAASPKFDVLASACANACLWIAD